MTFQLEGFEIGKRLGSGGFGDVWEARQLGVDRLVAIKVGNTPIGDAADQLRFERECKALGRLSTHAHIVTVYTSSQLPDGRPVLVLEYVDGGTLQHWALNNASSEPQLLNLGADLAAAVVEAHRHQILHRDLKPQNVLLRTTGEAILADFGIAHLQDGLRTVTGNVTASAAYAPPEVLDGERASEQSDLYGIGICLLAAATQTTPFTTSEDDTLYPVLTRVLTESPPDLTEHGYSAELNSLVQRLLAKNPADRPDSARSVLAEFQGMNAGLHRHQRVTPAATADDASADDPPTEGPATQGPATEAPSALAAAVSAPAAPTASPAAAPSNPPAEMVPPTAPAGPYSPPTAPAQPYVAPAATAPAAMAQSQPASGPSPALLAAIVGGIALLAVALFFVFGRSGGDETLLTVRPDPTVAAEANAAPAATPEPAAAAAAGNDQPTKDPATDEATAPDEPTTPDTEPPAAPDPAPVQPLPISEPLEVSDSIDIALDFREYPIELVAGQEVSVALTAMNDSCDRIDRFDLHIDVLGPDGQPIGDDGWPGNWGCQAFGGSDWLATEDGVHVVRFSSGPGGSSQPSTGAFEATIFTLRRQSEPLELVGNTTIDGVIDRPLDSSNYVVDLAAGQVLGLGIENINESCDRADRFDLRIRLLDPEGEQVGDEAWPGNWGCDESERWPIEVDGQHTLSFFSSDDTGAFRASVGVLKREQSTLDAGERVHAVQHTFEIPRDETDFELALTQGQMVSVEITSMNNSCDRADRFDLHVRVLDPDGRQVDDDGWPGNWGCQGFGPWEASVDGDYRIQFYETSGDIGTFEATIGRLGG